MFIRSVKVISIFAGLTGLVSTGMAQTSLEDFQSAPLEVINEVIDNNDPDVLFDSGTPEREADEQATYGDATMSNVAGMVTLLGGNVVIQAIRNNFEALTADIPVGHRVAQTMDDATIKKIMTRVHASPFRYVGMGLMGGADLFVEVDNAQVARNIGAGNADHILGHAKLSKTLDEKFGGVGSQVDQSLNGKPGIVLGHSPEGVDRAKGQVDLANQSKPNFSVDRVKLREFVREGKDAGLRAYLQELKASGATVRSVVLRGAIPKAVPVAGRVVTGFQYFLVGRAAMDGIAGVNYATYWAGGKNYEYMKDHCGSYNEELSQYEDCDSSLVGSWLNSADLVIRTAILNDDQLAD